jgi:L-alanine-DL-glutamate epimerase-like enolase superfamily enzyme
MGDEDHQVVAALRLTCVRPPPFPKPLFDATAGPFETFAPSVLRIDTSDGHQGIALVEPLAGPIVRDVLASHLLHQRVTTWPALRELCFWTIRNLGHAGLAMDALSSVDIAMHDLLGQIEGRALHKRLRIKRQRAPAYGSGGWVNLTTDELVAAMVAMRDRGFELVKMKVGVDQGRNPRADIDRVRAVRAAIGDDTKLAVDANQCWDAPTAVDVANRITDCRIEWFEEPVFAFDRAAAAEFAREAPIPLAAGESERLTVGFLEAIAADAVDILQPQPMHCGGITGFAEVVEAARRAWRTVVGSGPSFLTCQLLPGEPHPVMTEYLVDFMDSLASYFATAPKLTDGIFELPADPGNGMRLDEDFIKTHAAPGGWEVVE